MKRFLPLLFALFVLSGCASSPVLRYGGPTGAINTASIKTNEGQLPHRKFGAPGGIWVGGSPPTGPASGDLNGTYPGPGVGSIASASGGTVTIGDGTHNVAFTALTSLQATPPTLAVSAATGFGATSANANPGGAASVVAGAGGASVTSGTGGAGATASLVGGAGGASAGGSANANGGNAILGSGAAGTGGGGAAGVPGQVLLQVGGTTVGNLGNAATDFIALGAGTVAASGTALRVPVNAGVIISERNIGNTGDNNVVTLSNGNFIFGNGSQASLVSALIGGTGAYISTSGQTSSPSVNVAGTTVTITGATTIFNSASGVASASLTAGNWSWASGVATPTITQAALATQSATNGTAGVAMTFKSQDGQPATGASNNGGAGGVLNVSSGVGGTSGSATAGVGGALNLQVGGLTVGGYYATPAVGVSIAHSAAATTVLTTPQATSATSTQYTVQAVCRATTLFTGGATTDTFATLQHFTVRNVAGTLTNVASVTVDTSTQSDSSMSTNALSLSISGTNLNWQITPPALAAGQESCWVTSSAPGPF